MSCSGIKVIRLLAALAFAAAGPAFAAADPLSCMKSTLAEEKLFDFLLCSQEIEKSSPSEKDAAEAAGLLGKAAELSVSKGENMLAVDFYKAAARLDPGDHKMVLAAAEKMFGMIELSTARGLCDKVLSADPENLDALWLGARIDMARGLYEEALGPLEKIVKKGNKAPADLHRKASNALLDAKKALIERALLLGAAAGGFKGPDQEEAEEENEELERFEGGEIGREGDVILYTTSWCPACRSARRFLACARVKFTEKDVEQDASAIREVRKKLAKAGFYSAGVPVLDAGGEIVVGFDRGEYSKILENMFGSEFTRKARGCR